MRKLVISLLIISLVISGVPTTAHAESASRYEGAIVNFTAETEANYLSETSSLVAASGFEPVQHASLMFTDDGTKYVILSKTDPAVGKASVRGVEVLPPEGGLGIVVATSVEVNPVGTSVSLAELEKNPNKYQYDFVRVSASITQLTHTVDATEGKVVLQESVIGIEDRQSSFKSFGRPGREGKWSTVNLSLAKQNGEMTSELTGRLPLSTSSIGRAAQQTRWWMSTNATVNMLVVDGGRGGVAAIVGRVTPESTPVANVAELSSHTGEVVTVTTNGVGSSISTQETLLSAKKCAPSSITNPVTGCLPVPTDGVVHSGVLFDSPSVGSDGLVYYAGVSNTVQNTPVEPETGKYKITGRVVDANQVDPRLNGTALIVYDRERVGNLNVESNVATQHVSTLRDYIREQQLSSQSEWQSVTDEVPTSEEVTTEKSASTSDQSSGSSTSTSTTDSQSESPQKTTRVQSSDAAQQPESPTDSTMSSLKRAVNNVSSTSGPALVTGGGSIVFLLSGVILSVIDMVGKLRGNEHMEIDYEWVPWVMGVALLVMTYVYSTG